jgi:E3 ubiquitin-protein ligase UBR7
LEEEETYEPPLDEDDDNHSTHSAGSLLDLGERALGSVDRVKAIEGIMAYNNLKEGLKGLFKQFAEKREPVSAEAVKNYFAELRGEAPSSSGARQTSGSGGDSAGGTGDGRREQSGEAFY